MPDVADVARAMTDAAVANASAALPLVAGGAAALVGIVATCIAWLCHAELRRTGTSTGSRRQRATARGASHELAGVNSGMAWRPRRRHT